MKVELKQDPKFDDGYSLKITGLTTGKLIALQHILQRQPLSILQAEIAEVIVKKIEEVTGPA